MADPVLPDGDACRTAAGSSADEGAGHDAEPTPTGLSAAVLAVTLWGGGNVLVAAVPIDGLSLAFLRLWLAFAVYAAVTYLAVVTTAGTFLLLQYASMRLPASKVLGYGYLTPSFIILLEGILGHGWASLPVLAGALITACGLALMAFLPD